MLNLAAEILPDVSILPKRGVQVSVSIAVSLVSQNSIYMYRRDAGGFISAGILTLTSDQDYLDFRQIPYVSISVRAVLTPKKASKANRHSTAKVHCTLPADQAISNHPHRCIVHWHRLAFGPH